MVRQIDKILVTPNFEKSFMEIPKDIQNISAIKDKWFRNNAFDPRLKTHSLKGKLKGLWSYYVNRTYRVLFEFITDTEVLYHNIGTHEIYR